MMRFFPPIRQALIAPSRTDLAGSGTTSSGTNRSLRPRPPQVRHAPSPWLNEKCRGRQPLERHRRKSRRRATGSGAIRATAPRPRLGQERSPGRGLRGRRARANRPAGSAGPARRPGGRSPVRLRPPACRPAARSASSRVRSRAVQAHPLEAALAQARQLLAQDARLGPQAGRQQQDPFARRTRPGPAPRCSSRERWITRPPSFGQWASPASAQSSWA